MKLPSSAHYQGHSVSDTSWLMAALVCFSAFYVGGMYLNDAFDRKIDAVERPTRPIPAGRVAAGAVFGAGFALLIAGIVGVVMWARAARGESGLDAGLAGLALAGAIVLYDAYHKNNPLSPVLMGLCRVLVYVTASVALTGTVGAAVALGALALLAHLIGLTYAAKQENLVRLEGVWPLALLLYPVGYGFYLGLDQPLTWGFAVLLAVWVTRSVRLLLVPEVRSIPGAVVRLIAGIALVDAMLLAATGAVSLALVAVGMCALTRLFQRVVPGT
jgi:4-hydroxybenzoate polyprenyltransferase